LIDVVAPNISGYDLLRLLNEKVGPKIPILFVTATKQSKLDMTGADGFIKKPFSAKSLLDGVRKALTLSYISEDKDYFREVLKLIKRSKNKKICYVTFNKTADSLKEVFKEEKIDIKMFYFVDCITLGIKIPKREADNCDYIPKASELSKISESIKKAIKKGYTLLIFDSLSNLLTYGINVKFLKSFLPKLKEKNGEAAFICKLKGKEHLLIRDMLPIFDKMMRDKNDA
jgi:hypothetical protein